MPNHELATTAGSTTSGGTEGSDQRLILLIYVPALRLMLLTQYRISMEMEINHMYESKREGPYATFSTPNVPNLVTRRFRFSLEGNPSCYQ